MITKLQSLLPRWHFERYGSAGAVACFPPGQTNAESWHELSRVAVISSVCGPFYSVCQLREPDNARESEQRRAAQAADRAKADLFHDLANFEGKVEA